MRVRTASAIGTAIRSRRRELKLSQATLAKKIGVARRWVIEIEKGKPTAELDLVLKALAALHLTLDVTPQSSLSSGSVPLSTSVRPSALDIDIDHIVSSAKKRGGRSNG